MTGTRLSRNGILAVVCTALFLSLVALSAVSEVRAQEIDAYFPDAEWRTSTPQEQGISKTILDEMVDFYSDNDVKIDALLIVKNGFMIAEEYPSVYSPDDLHHIFSCTKSILSILIGIAIDEAVIPSLDTKMLDYFPVWAENAQDSRMHDITIANLLTMTMGIEWTEYYREYESDFDTMTREMDWVSYILSKNMYIAPGEEFVYNSGASHLLSAILQKASGISSLEFARMYLLNPLGITNVDWETDPSGIFRGDSRMRLVPRDLARIGYLLLKGGFWGSDQIVSTDWIKEASTNYVNTTIILPTGEGRILGYGHQWWIDPQLAYYAAIGWGGQSMIIFPQYDLVFVMAASSAHYSVSTDYIVREWLLRALGEEVPEPLEVASLSPAINMDSIRMLLIYSVATIPIPIALIKIKDDEEEPREAKAH